ncbi:hypothetical protein ACFYPC_03270 [Streptomyces sp. NPDC005808]|uniref:hypothetical protein n=1 Tax=Streptomyces sp. NPDC005808 TaxID=3364734 RepID=UPI0036A7BD9E
MRWWIAGRTVHALLLTALGGLAGLAVAIATMWTLTERSPRSVGVRFSDHEQLFDLSLTALRACVGTDNLQPEPDSTPHQLLATLASVTGSLVPAVLLGIVLIKMFTVRPLVWRDKASVSLATMSHSPVFADANRGGRRAVIAVRFYQHILNVDIMDARAEAHLRFLEESPRRDGLLALYKQRLKVVGEDGVLCDERVWRVVEQTAPFTLWIPVGSPVDTLPLTSLQGKDLRGLLGVRILVRFSARAVGTGTELNDERWFSLDDESLELGQFVPVKPDLELPVNTWEGWGEFDALRPEDPTRPAS